MADGKLRAESPALPSGDMRPQVDKFRDLARELEADEDEARFEETVKKVVNAPKADTKEGRE